ncbi:MAG: DUF255 domain-containing protein [Cyclobacteriaceae bacterium]|nr:DUF255 domain-containing protein [Cyclobacteriaceae bacterium HetDA_MAG_MS6]
MTYLWILILGLSWHTESIEGGEIEWLTIDQVQVKMKEEPKPVFIDVVADWCKWCKVMEKETFTDDKVIDYVAKNYYAVRLDYENLKKVTFLGETYSEKGLAQDWNIRDLPTIVLWDEGFETKIMVKGYKKPGPFLQTLKSFRDF